MTKPDQTSGETRASGTIIVLPPRLGRKAAIASVLKRPRHDKRLRSWLVLFVILLMIIVPPTLAAFTAIFALWLFALSVALALNIFVDLARRSLRWARSPVPV
jgi:hypothetical protein